MKRKKSPPPSTRLAEDAKREEEIRKYRYIKTLVDLWSTTSLQSAPAMMTIRSIIYDVQVKN